MLLHLICIDDLGTITFEITYSAGDWRKLTAHQDPYQNELYDDEACVRLQGLWRWDGTIPILPVFSSRPPLGGIFVPDPGHAHPMKLIGWRHPPSTTCSSVSRTYLASRCISGNRARGHVMRTSLFQMHMLLLQSLYKDR
jgi:hypothetical protein